MFNKRAIQSILVLLYHLFFLAGMTAVLMGLAIPRAMARSEIEGVVDNKIFLPLVVKNFPFTPPAPVLEAINNPGGDGSYTVSWSASEGADTYTLQEDDSASFSSPVDVYNGSNTSTILSGRDIGSYYYRVKGANPYASSGWSNVQSVVVTVPPPNCPQSWAWAGTTSQGSNFEITFGVENSPQCQIAAESLSIRFRDSCGSYRTTVFNYAIPITNNHFDTGVGAGTRVMGDFPTPTTANGTFSYANTTGSCTASGTWTANYNLGANGMIRSMALQPDGKIVVAGGFTTLGGQQQKYIGRLNADGSLDATFTPVMESSVNTVAVQTDGKILVGGRFTRVNGDLYPYIVRLNTDGTPDASFNPGSVGSYLAVEALQIQTDGKIVVGGYFSRMGGVTVTNLARLNANGTYDDTFTPPVFSSTVDRLAMQSNGQILVGMSYSGTLGDRCYIYRLNTNGTKDNTFTASVTGAAHSTEILALLVQANGKILVGGDFINLNGVAHDDLGRLNSDGTLDTSFTLEPSFYVYALARQADNKILVGGPFTTLGGETHEGLGRINTNDTVDAAFNPSIYYAVYTFLVQPDGKIVVGGDFIAANGEPHYYIVRLNADGTVDPTFQ
jgi:uncharacterized delta-60 repeat protein